MAETTNAHKTTPEPNPNPNPTPKDNPTPNATTTTAPAKTRAPLKPKPTPKPKPRATKRAVCIDEREALRRRANNERIRRSRMRKVESEIASGVRGGDGKVKRSTERPWW